MSKFQKRRRQKQDTTSDQQANVTVLRRCLAVMGIFGVLIFVVLIWQLYQVMIVDHDKYERMAINNQTRSTTVSASRGTIYDRNMNVLSISASVNNVFISPNEIAQKEQDIDLIADGLAQILDTDADKIREMAKDTSMY